MMELGVSSSWLVTRFHLARIDRFPLGQALSVSEIPDDSVKW